MSEDQIRILCYLSLPISLLVLTFAFACYKSYQMDKRFEQRWGKKGD